MADKPLPSTMRIWKASPEAQAKPTSRPSPRGRSQPSGLKPAEASIVGSLAVKKPATPGFDFAGRIVTPADGSDFEPGQLVYGAASTSPFAGGALAEYIAVPEENVCPAPSGLSPLDMGGAPVAAITAYGSLIPHIRSGSRVFINGGSGGVGTYAIQIAKAAGAHVTVSCSAKNGDLCRSLGADDVLDYNARPLLDQLRDAASTTGRPFDHVTDNVFSDPALYFQAHTYTTPDAKFAEVASAPSLAFMRFAIAANLWPSFLGGGKRKLVLVMADIKHESLEQIRNWFVDGKIKAVTDSVFPMDETVEAFERLKTGRARGKVIVNVAGEK